jgi:hypothetical protein
MKEARQWLDGEALEVWDQRRFIGRLDPVLTTRISCVESSSMSRGLAVTLWKYRKHRQNKCNTRDIKQVSAFS